MNAKTAIKFSNQKMETVVCIVPMELWPALLFRKVEKVTVAHEI
tara:strand:- start:220 stop:351 length:132 start_codon:yes stop_codon:yes gene_type:complete